MSNQTEDGSTPRVFPSAYVYSAWLEPCRSQLLGLFLLPLYMGCHPNVFKAK